MLGIERRCIKINNNFIVYLTDDNFKLVTNEEDIIKSYCKVFSLQEILDLIAKALKIQTDRYGYTIYIKNESIGIRFGNITTKKKDNPVDFIKNNWDEGSIYNALYV